MVVLPRRAVLGKDTIRHVGGLIVLCCGGLDSILCDVFCREGWLQDTNVMAKHTARSIPTKAREPKSQDII